MNKINLLKDRNTLFLGNFWEAFHLIVLYLNSQVQNLFKQMLYYEVNMSKNMPRRKTLCAFSLKKKNVIRDERKVNPILFVK